MDIFVSIGEFKSTKDGKEMPSLSANFYENGFSIFGVSYLKEDGEDFVGLQLVKMPGCKNYELFDCGELD